MSEKSRKRKYLILEQESTINRLKDGITNLENQMFKMKIELETYKVDKQMLEDINKRQLEQLMNLKKEKDQMFHDFGERLCAIDTFKE